MIHKSGNIEDKVISAVKTFASAINSGAKGGADMSELIAVTSQLPLLSFDYWERLIRTEFSSSLSGTMPPKWKIWAKPEPFVTWLDLLSWDGYKRENALRALSGPAPNTFFYAIAVRRLNDWVPAVRRAAREKLLAISRSTNPEYVVEAICVTLSNWNSWGRIELADKAVLLQIIGEKGIAKSLRSKLILSASGPMPSLFSQLGRTPILDDHIEEIAKTAIQPSVRAKAYRCLFESRVVWVEGRKWVWTDLRYCVGRLEPILGERTLEVSTPLVDLLKRSAEDCSSVVRRISAEILIRELGNLGLTATVFAEQFAADNSKSVSERGEFALKCLNELATANAS